MKIIECPRDAWQGMSGFIPTDVKAAYINRLLKVGFHTIDFGSFVSPVAMPQVRDTLALVKMLDLSSTNTRLLAIVANERGAREAVALEEISDVGFPFSISNTFQLRNANASMSDSLSRVEAIQQLCMRSKKQLVVYLSMGFGNPYGDPWSTDILLEWIERLSRLEIHIFSLADTVGLAEVTDIATVFGHLIPAFPALEFGAHFHSAPALWQEKIEAAHQAGCRRFDSAILGYGGCPMAQNDLVGNIATENLISYAAAHHDMTYLDESAFKEAKNYFAAAVSGVIL